MIEVSNVRDGESLPHSLALIEGDVTRETTTTCDSVVIVVARQSGDKDVAYPVVRGRFKSLVQLSVGLNVIHLELATSSTGNRLPGSLTTLRLSHDPDNVVESTSRRLRSVQLLYVVCADDADGGRFQGPPNEPADRFTLDSAARRIVLGARLVQTFTAENLVRRHGLPRRTFRIHDDDVDRPEIVCRVLKLDVPVTRARSMSQRDLWCLVRDTLATTDCNVDLKYVAFLSFTRYVCRHGDNDDGHDDDDDKYAGSHEDVVRLTGGHAALGGGGLALLGTGCLHTWAETVSEVVTCFTDVTPVDRRFLMDDSAYRGTYWGCYATTLGAVCHELGHTLQLEHCDDGIMGRGFGDIHRAFVVVVNDLDNSLCPREGRHDDWGDASWNRSSAVWLSYHKWFNPGNAEADSKQGPKWHVQTSEIRARHGIRVVVLLEQGDHGDRRVVRHWEFTRNFGTPVFRLTTDGSCDDDRRRPMSIKAMDTFGNILDAPLDYSK